MIMQVLWERGQANAGDYEDLNRQGDRASRCKHARKLEAKGSVRHRIDERTFVFMPAVAAERVTKNATRELIQRVFGGSAAVLVAHLLKEEKITPDELKSLRRLIEEKAATRKPA